MRLLDILWKKQSEMYWQNLISKQDSLSELIPGLWTYFSLEIVDILGDKCTCLRTENILILLQFEKVT